MKARLAKKIAHMPVNRLSPRWLDRFIRGDDRIYEAVRKLIKKEREENLKGRKQECEYKNVKV